MKEKLKIGDIRVFVCVPGVGKTHLAMHDDRFVDLDREKSMFKYGFDPKTESAEFEKIKCNPPEKKRSGSAEYIKKRIIEELERGKIVLLAPQPEFQEFLVTRNIPYCFVYYTADCKEEIRQRMIARGNTESFIKAMIDPFDEFFRANEEDKKPTFKIVMKRGEYLSDRLYKVLEDYFGGEKKDLHKRSAGTKGERDFHKSRRAFMIIGDDIHFLEDSTMSHFDWAKTLGIGEAQFEKLVRGFFIDGRAVFYKGRFVYDDECISAAKKFGKRVKEYCNVKTLDVWCGQKVGKIGDIWPPDLFIERI